MSNATNPVEAALVDFTDACYAQEAAARRYCRGLVAYVRDSFQEFCLEQDEDADLGDLASEYANDLETVIYTRRARALVMGYGEDKARYEFGAQLGFCDPGEEWGVLAACILERECREVAELVEYERED
jgi:hypothetical protein